MRVTAILKSLFITTSLPNMHQPITGQRAHIGRNQKWFQTMFNTKSSNAQVGFLIVAVVVLLAGFVSVVTAFKNKNGELALRDCFPGESIVGTFVDIPEGSFVKGAQGHYPEEGTPMRLHVSPLLLQVNEVTNDQFAEFVQATGYVTEAERGNGSAQFVETETPRDLLSWWRLDVGATWKSPGGEGTDLEGMSLHPVSKGRTGSHMRKSGLGSFL